MFITNHYQNAYVTTDLAHAVQLLQERFGAPQAAMQIEAVQTVWTPDGVGEARVKLAFLQVGALQYELIEPVSGAVAIYRDALPAQAPLGFHHIAMRTDDVDAVAAHSERLGRKVVYRGDGAQVRFAYVDARAELGHYLEYVQAPAAFWARFQ